MRQEVTKTLADFASSVRFSDLPEEALRHSKKCILDLLGVALAGSMTIPGRIIIDFVKKLGGKPEATVISNPLMVPCTNAALANGTLAHALELDDGSRYAMGHPGVVVIPAALAAAESNDVSGKDLMTAVVLGYETFIRLGSAVNPSHFRRGFHTTGTCGTFAAAVAAGKILGLDEDGMANALGLAGTQSAGLFEFVSDGSMSKPLHPGRSAQSGVLAALLAQKGFTGPKTMIEGERGFCRAYSDSYDFDKLLKGLGQEYKITQIYFKFHAACRHAHPAIDCALEIRKRHLIEPGEIKSIDVDTYSIAQRATDIPEPKTVLAAKMSLQYGVAVALVEGRAGLDEYETEKIGDKRVQELARKVVLNVSPELDKLVPEKRGAIVRVRMRSGEEFEFRTDLAKGEPEHPAKDKELKDKFKNLGAKAADDDTIQRLIKKVDQIDRLKSLTSLCELLR